VLRRLSATARELSRDYRQVKRWAVRHAWHERVTAYDRYLASAAIAARRAEAERIEARQLEVADQLLDAVAEAVEHIDPRRMTPDQIVRWAAAGTMIQRRVIEMQALGTPAPTPALHFTSVAIDQPVADSAAGPVRSALAAYLDRHPDRIHAVTTFIEQRLAMAGGNVPRRPGVADGVGEGS
jgi:hypothetical protein